MTATLVSPDLQHNTRDTATVNDSDISSAEDIVKLLSPLKTATFTVATFCFLDSFAHSLHSFNRLHKAVTWNAFQTNSLEGVPIYA